MTKQSTSINKNIFERCLLTDLVPYETPLLFSNWGAFNYEHNLKETVKSSLIKELFSGTQNELTIPYSYSIYKDISDRRSLQIPHPSLSRDAVVLYEKFDVLIAKLGARSSFSIRAPHSIARHYLTSKSVGSISKYVEQFDEDQLFGSSYFTYRHYSHLYKFFESRYYSFLEHRFSRMMHFDISKCFPSIYTHSISWAVRGKLEAKSRAFNGGNNRQNVQHGFPEAFDRFMQSINYRETNGIIIGPEISRIFAEIILQWIDCKVEKALPPSTHDYVCCRYIDDYYVFYNDEKTLRSFEERLKQELEQFKLYLNPSKRETIHRPFITEASRLKVLLSNYLRDLNDRVVNHFLLPPTSRGPKWGTLNIEKEFNSIRAMVGTHKEAFDKVTNFFLSALSSIVEKKLWRIKEPESLLSSYMIFFQLGMHWLKLDIRVSGTFKILTILSVVLRGLRKVSEHLAATLKSVLYVELKDAFVLAFKRRAVIEALNLLIGLRQLGERYRLPPQVLSEFFKSFRLRGSSDLEGSKPEVDYFVIVTVLYYIARDSEYIEARQLLFQQAELMLKANHAKVYSESMHLFLDLLVCPHLEKEDKLKLIAIHKGLKWDEPTRSQLGTTLKELEREARTWFFNWTPKGDLGRWLKKKQFMLSY